MPRRLHSRSGAFLRSAFLLLSGFIKTQPAESSRPPGGGKSPTLPAPLRSAPLRAPTPARPTRAGGCRPLRRLSPTQPAPRAGRWFPGEPWRKGSETPLRRRGRSPGALRGLGARGRRLPRGPQGLGYDHDCGEPGAALPRRRNRQQRPLRALRRRRRLLCPPPARSSGPAARRPPGGQPRHRGARESRKADAGKGRKSHASGACFLFSFFLF